MSRRIFAAALCLCLALTLLPARAGAVPATTVIAGGVTLDGATNIYATTDGAGLVTAQPGYTESDPWNIKFQNGMLTLKNATIAGVTAQYYSSFPDNYAIYSTGELRLVLEGSNTVYSADPTRSSAGIYIAGSETGVNNAALTIEGGGRLLAYAEDGGSTHQSGISVRGDLILNSGTVIAEGRGTDGNSFGVHSTNRFTMTGGSLTATGGNVTGNFTSAGVYSSGPVAISGGTLTATGGTGTLNGFGLSSGVANGITISPSTGGTVKVTAETTHTASDYRGAFNRQPVIADGAYYTWSLTEGGTPTPSTTAPYVRTSTWPSDVYTELTLGQAVAMPTISPASGAYNAAQNVTLACATPGATIRYTLDGSDPTQTSGTAYAGPFPVASSCVVKARAFKSEMSQSDVGAAEFTLPSAAAASVPKTGDPADPALWMGLALLAGAGLSACAALRRKKRQNG